MRERNVTAARDRPFVSPQIPPAALTQRPSIRSLSTLSKGKAAEYGEMRQAAQRRPPNRAQNIHSNKIPLS